MWEVSIWWTQSSTAFLLKKQTAAKYRLEHCCRMCIALEHNQGIQHENMISHYYYIVSTQSQCLITTLTLHLPSNHVTVAILVTNTIVEITSHFLATPVTRDAYAIPSYVSRSEKRGNFVQNTKSSSYYHFKVMRGL